MFELNVIEKDGKQMVNARELYKQLDLSKRDNYSKWIKSNLIENEWFVQGKDFTYSNTLTGGRPRKDHVVTFNTAKHLCMMSRSKNGHKAREYFIKIEEAYTSGQLIESTDNQLQLVEDLESSNKKLVKAVEARDKMINQAIVALQAVNPIDPIGTPSKTNGKPRTKLRRACYVSTKNGDPNQLVLGFNFER